MCKKVKWKALVSKGGGIIEIHEVGLNKHRRYICDIMPEVMAKDDPVATSDAKLIAAAPCLLEALCKARVLLDSMGAKPTEDIPIIGEILNNIENALNKAKGEQV